MSLKLCICLTMFIGVISIKMVNMEDIGRIIPRIKNIEGIIVIQI